MDLIIGGGITGLSYALFKGDNDYLIIERENELGGYCKTIKRNGFIWDYSGHFFHFRNEDIKKMLLNALIERDEIVEVNKETHIKYKEIWVDFPFQKNIHQLEKGEFIECLVDLFSEKEIEFSTFKQMLEAKFGQGICKKFLIPYNEKLYACKLDELDKDAMGRFFPYANKEEIILNFKEQNNSSYNGSFIYPKNGAIEYIKEIEKHLDCSKILKQTSVSSININDKFIILSSGETIKYDRLISTLPFPKLLDFTSTEYDENTYSWNQVLVFNLGFKSKVHKVNSHWIYFPEKKYCFYRVGLYNNILGQNTTSLYVELGFNKDQNINPNEWLGQVITDLKKANIIEPDSILSDYESIIMNPAYVHISEKSRKDVLKKKEAFCKFDIYSIGRYGSWTYCSIEDNILEAKKLANLLNKKQKTCLKY